MKRLIPSLWVLVLIPVLFSCNKIDVTESCPTCSPVVSWTSYGELNLLRASYNGYFTIADYTVVSLHLDCGWDIYNELQGGSNGRPYAVTDCDNSVLMYWEDTFFQYLELYDNWEGTLDTGLKMGANLDNFLLAYPDFERLDATPDFITYTYSEKRFRVFAYFELGGQTLSKLRIERN